MGRGSPTYFPFTTMTLVGSKLLLLALPVRLGWMPKAPRPSLARAWARRATCWIQRGSRWKQRVRAGGAVEDWPILPSRVGTAGRVANLFLYFSSWISLSSNSSFGVRRMKVLSWIFSWAERPVTKNSMSSALKLFCKESGTGPKLFFEREKVNPSRSNPNRRLKFNSQIRATYTEW